QIAEVAVDPVADQLHPAVAAPGLLGHVRGEVLRLDLPGVVPDVAAGTGDVPTGPDDLREVVAGVGPAGVGGRAGVTQQQGAGVTVGERLLLGDVVGDGAVPVQAHRAVGVDKAGQHPAVDGTDVAGAGGTVVRDPSVDDPQLAPYLVRADEDPPLHVQHRAFAHSRHSCEALRRHAQLVGGLLLVVR